MCDCACVRHTHACGNLGAKEVRSFMDLCVRMCVRAEFALLNTLEPRAVDSNRTLNFILDISVSKNQSVSVRLCVRASHACVRKSRCEGGAKLHGFVRANVRACRVFWVRHTRAITLEIFQ